MTLIATKRLTADEFMAMPDAENYELIDGQLVEREFMGAYAGNIAAKIIFQLEDFNRRRPTGWVFPSETMFRCFDMPDTLRRADASFIRFGRLPGERPPEGYIRIAPDLAVEVISPSNTADKVEEKVLEYLNAGVEIVWVVYPHARTVHVRRRQGPPDVLNESQQLDCGNVLPGFSCAVKDIFPPKTPVPAKP